MLSKDEPADISGMDVLALPDFVRPKNQESMGYSGPWVEDFFYQFWMNLSAQDKGGVERTYLPVFWTMYYKTHMNVDFIRRFLKSFNLYNGRLFRSLQEVVDEFVDPDLSYFTIVQADNGIRENLPENVLVFSAGGVGDIPVPLLKPLPESSYNLDKDRDILVSFMGKARGAHDRNCVRSRLLKALDGYGGLYTGFGSLDEFADVTSRSVFTLCPRGYGRTSFRLYEALQLGSIPVYVWDDLEWLPYRDVLDWGQFSISVNVENVGQIPDIIDSHTDAMIRKKQKRIGELYEEYFTLEGTCKQILRMLKGR